MNTNNTIILDLTEILPQGATPPDSSWKLKALQSEQCVSYIAWNEKTKEAILVDAKVEDEGAYLKTATTLCDYHWLGVIDTHTHADHVSCAAKMAVTLQTPLIMHEKSPTRRAHIRVSQITALYSQAAPLKFLPTPGHTPDSLTLLWGPFLFGGDTLMIGDTGRDDLPGGSPEDHYDSLELIKKYAQPEQWVLPGHVSGKLKTATWASQLKDNPSLMQSREDFVRESSAFDAPAPLLLKKSLRENFK